VLDLSKPIKTTFEQTSLREMECWFSELPDDAAWYVVSDYCFGDKTKNSDTVSFSILLNHDKIENIKEYIRAFAPKDIKSTRTVSEGFIQYINSPVIFHITFMIDRKTKYMKDYATKENMEDFLSYFREFVSEIDKNSSFDDGFTASVIKRSYEFERDFKSKNINLKLSRQIYLVSVFVSLVFYYLNRIKNPSHIKWVSDRDAISKRYDGFIYDLSYFLFLSEVSQEVGNKDGTKTLLHKPQFIFPVKEELEGGKYDELIRIPDYLAGTLADLNMDTGEFTKDKFYTVFFDSLVGSKNHSVIQIYGNGERLSSRRIGYKYT
jgi:hypothetical protein